MATVKVYRWAIHTLIKTLQDERKSRKGPFEKSRARAQSHWTRCGSPYRKSNELILSDNYENSEDSWPESWHSRLPEALLPGHSIRPAEVPVRPVGRHHGISGKDATKCQDRVHSIDEASRRVPNPEEKDNRPYL